jgi:hypothetical protein
VLDTTTQPIEQSSVGLPTEPLSGCQLAAATSQVTWIEHAPQQPDVSLLRQFLHRGDRAFAAFHVGADDTFESVGSMPTDMLADNPDQLRRLLNKDGHVSINSMYRCGHRFFSYHRHFPAVIEGQHVQRERKVTRRLQKIPNGGGLCYAHRDSRSVRWVNAAYVDLDGHAFGMGEDDLRDRLLHAVRGGVVPHPSLLLASGRGLWAFWLVKDNRNPAAGELRVGKYVHHAVTPCQCNSRTLRLLRQVNEALVSRLRDLGADAASTSVAKTCRVPGSLNPKAKRRVRLLESRLDGQTPYYTLEQLHDWLCQDTGQCSETPKRRAVRSPGRSERHRRAAKARFLKVFDSLMRLAEMRRGFKEGHRNAAIFQLAYHGRLAGVPDLRPEVRRVAAAMHPPLGEREARRSFDSGCSAAKEQHTKPPRFSKIRFQLGISDEEARSIGLMTRLEQAAVRAPVGRHVQKRHLAKMTAVAAMVEGLGYRPSCRAMATALRGEGVVISPRTVARLYHEMGAVEREAA